MDGASETLIAHGHPGTVPRLGAIQRGGGSRRRGRQPHSSACLEFASNAGLWLTGAFAGDEAREKWKSPVTAALRLLADSGFGGERSRGWGRAEIEISDQDRPLVDAPKAAA